MSELTIPPRSAIPAMYCWNAESVYPSAQAWEAEYQGISAALAELGKYRGRLAGSPAVLADCLTARDALLRRVYRLTVYASLAHSVDTTDQAAASLRSEAYGLVGQVLAAVAFVDPELVALGRETVQRWLAAEPRLGLYAHYFDDRFRRVAHLRSAEVEELLGMLADPFSGAQVSARMLADADLQFRPARTRDGGELPVAQGTIDGILAGPDREARRTAWESYADAYLAHKNTLGALLETSIKQNVVAMRARRHSSTLEASLFENDLPVEVFHNLIDTFRRHLPTWHRYWALRRRALRVDKLYPYDIWAPLGADRPEVTYPQAVEWIAQGLAPLGEEYVRVLRKGCLENRWVDVYPNQGKTSGAFSSGSPGTYPFIVMSYDNTVFSLGALAHELGHSMHSYLAWQAQPTVYADYSLFEAEVASNLHQAMLRSHLLAQDVSPALKLGVLEEAMSNFHRYFLIMPTLARFELEVHERVERGQGLSAGDMIELMADLFEEGYGGEMAVDRQREGITWATFGHLYADYYVFQYATGISAAHALSRRILSGVEGAGEAYLAFLRAGSSLYPLDALKMAGVDLSTPEPVEETFEVLSGLVDQLEGLVALPFAP